MAATPVKSDATIKFFDMFLCSPSSPGDHTKHVDICPPPLLSETDAFVLAKNPAGIWPMKSIIFLKQVFSLSPNHTRCGSYGMRKLDRFRKFNLFQVCQVLETCSIRRRSCPYGLNAQKQMHLLDNTQALQWVLAADATDRQPKAADAAPGLCCCVADVLN